MAAERPKDLYLLILVPIFVGILIYPLLKPKDVTKLGGPIAGLNRVEREKFDECKRYFEHEFTVSEGLGPLYNGQSCYSCHGSPGIAGGEGSDPAKANIIWVANRKLNRPLSEKPLSEVRHLLMLADVESVKAGPYLFRHSITDLNSSGKSMVDESECKVEASAEIPKVDLVSRRLAPPLFGVGMLNAVMDDDIDDHEDDATDENSLNAGRSIDVHDPLTAKLRVGRFGWKAQSPNLVNMTSFMMNAGPGISTPLYEERIIVDDLPRCILPHLPPDPNDMGAGAAKLIYYLSLLAPPERGPITEEVKRGEQVFQKLECAFCHTPSMQTAPSVRVIDPSSPAPKFHYNKVAALSDKTFYPYTDMLLHYMGPALSDGVPEGKSSGGEWRTPPLWGLRFRKHLLHDGRAGSIESAIKAHDGQAADSRSAYEKLSPAEQQDLLQFLRSL